MFDEKTVFAAMESELGGGGAGHDKLQGKVLYHYTDALGFEGIIKSKTLWATHFRHLNDKGELSAGERVVNEEAKELAPNLKTEIQTWFVETFEPIHQKMGLSNLADVFVASLTEHEDELSQWRGYGDRTAGYALGFSDFRLPRPDATSPDATLALHLARCRYDKAAYRKRVRGVLTEIAQGFERFVAVYARTDGQVDSIARHATAIALRRVAALVLGYKVAAFESELEWRLIAMPPKGGDLGQTCFRPGHGVVVPYVPVDLCEEKHQIALTSVMLGPTVDPDRGEHGARMLLKRHGYNPDIVRRSAIPFRG